MVCFSSHLIGVKSNAPVLIFYSSYFEDTNCSTSIPVCEIYVKMTRFGMDLRQLAVHPKACIVSANAYKAQSRQSAKLFHQSSELGLPQTLTRGGRAPPPPGSGGRGTLAVGRGVGTWESLNSDEGTYAVVLFIYAYFVF
jgi:hypothetical protein